VEESKWTVKHRIAKPMFHRRGSTYWDNESKFWEQLTTAGCSSPHSNGPMDIDPSSLKNVPIFKKQNGILIQVGGFNQHKSWGSLGCKIKNMMETFRQAISSLSDCFYHYCRRSGVNGGPKKSSNNIFISKKKTNRLGSPYIYILVGNIHSY
jgi:hypothetical protein